MRGVLRFWWRVFGQVWRGVDADCRPEMRFDSGTVGADVVVGGDLGCLINIEGRLRRRGDENDTAFCTSPKCWPAGAKPDVAWPSRSQAMHFHARAGRKGAECRRCNGLCRRPSRYLSASGPRASPALAEDGLAFRSLLRCNLRKNIRNRTCSPILMSGSNIFEERATATGAEVLWARDGAEVSRSGRWTLPAAMA